MANVVVGMPLLRCAAAWPSHRPAQAAPTSTAAYLVPKKRTEASVVQGGADGPTPTAPHGRSRQVGKRCQNSLGVTGQS
jgi:hypothetical protein